MNKTLSLASLLLLAAPLFARVSEYKHFPQSPQGFYMTKAERSEWAKITNDDDAKTFIDAFRAKRSPELLKTAAERAAKADEYLTLGKTLGSDSLRGKLIILLGPPAAMEVSTIGHEGHAELTQDAVLNAAGEATPGGSANNLSENDVAKAIQSAGTTYNTTDYYTFKYSAKNVPGRDKDLTVMIVVDGNSGVDRLSDRKAAADLDEIFERIAQASIVTTPNH
jgi:hypothetical protein